MANLSVPDVFVRDSALWQPYCAFLDCALISDLPGFSAGPDSLEIVPAGYPYPASGTNLGLVIGHVKIKKGAQISPIVPSGLDIVPTDREYKSYQRTIEFQLASSGRKSIIDLFDDPGPRSSIDSYGGGQVEVPDHNLVLMFNDFYHPEIFMCLIHFSVSLQSADEEYGSDIPLLINAQFAAFAGKRPDDPDCTRNRGQQIWRRVFIDSTGTMIDPSSGIAPVPQTGAKDFVPVSDMMDGAF